MTLSARERVPRGRVWMRQTQWEIPKFSTHLQKVSLLACLHSNIDEGAPRFTGRQRCHGSRALIGGSLSSKSPAECHRFCAGDWSSNDLSKRRQDPQSVTVLQSEVSQKMSQRGTGHRRAKNADRGTGHLSGCHDRGHRVPPSTLGRFGQRCHDCSPAPRARCLGSKSQEPKRCHGLRYEPDPESGPRCVLKSTKP